MLYPSLSLLYQSQYSFPHLRRIEEPDDAVVKITVRMLTRFREVSVTIDVIQLAGLCGSDLHIYRGHEEFDKSYAELSLSLNTTISMSALEDDHGP